VSHLDTSESVTRRDRDGATQPLSLVGDSAAVSALRASIDAVSDAPCVLLEAEAGLDLVELARNLHRHRSAGAFVAIDCAALEPAAVERDLLGTMASRVGELEHIDPRSALARAAGGTLYLEDLPELSASVQGRLARVTRDGEVQVADTAQRLDVRIVASATDVDADERQGRLRRDLLRHFARSRIVVPPLRRRPEDLPLLIARLVEASCIEAGVPAKTLTNAAMTLLAAMPWRGNLAELRNAIARLINTVDGSVVQIEDVLPHVRFDGALVPRSPSGALKSARQQFERDYIAMVLQQHRWRIGDAARALGMQRTNLYRKARQLGIAVTRPGYRS
jgi:two-component system, NtrC family, nitrogen regulation response regulator NtrX